jgi:amino-acid N-acetyltransferase
MDQQAIGFRHATELDQSAIRALVHSERLNPIGITWTNFLVAAMGERIVGAAQVRKHSDGSRELGSLVVAKDARGNGIASRMIDTLLAEEREPIWLITSEPFANAYARWGFYRIEPRTAPVKVRHNYRMGSMARIISFFRRQPRRQLVILERLPVDGRKSSRAAAGR